MRIHTVKEGDTIFKIAREYSTPPSKIIENNALTSPDRLYPGQKLVIFTPTRCYTVRGGDSLDMIARRFETDEGSLIRNNPALLGKNKIYPGKILAIKYEPPPYGNAAANGYYSESCPIERLMLFLPYLTYLSVSACIWREKRLTRLFNFKDLAPLARSYGVIPLLRVYTKLDAKALDSECDELLASIISQLKQCGFAGLTLAAYNAAYDGDAFPRVLTKIKSALSRENFHFHLELDGNRDISNYGIYGNTADAVVLNYEKLGEDKIPDFKDGEERLMRNYSQAARCNKTLFDITELAFIDGNWHEISEAEKICIRTGALPAYSDEKKISSFLFNKYSGGKREAKRAVFSTPENTKAKLELIAELGFMGVSFDIKACPISTLMFFNLSFSSEKAGYYDSQGSASSPPADM